jgi:dipeptidase D
MIIKIFKEITKIPRCSGTHEPFINYMKEFASMYAYECKIDNANNILCYKADVTPSICLQAHYDIVCLEDGKIPQVIEEDGYLKALDSTLGSDNGIGCAYMLNLMSQGENVECLFTCDEEIGLIGANDIAHTLKAKYMLNLDSEEEEKICIGCAGGIDIFASNTNAKLIPNNENKNLYELSIDNLDGGHSGVDIDKNIPNALKLMAQSIKECNGDLLDFNGGERINSIPKRAKAIIASKSTPIPTHPNMKIEKVDTPTQHYKKLDSNIINFLYSFANGVRGYDKEVDVVTTSINLAIIETTIDDIKISLSARSMDNNELKSIANETIVLLENFGFEVSTSGKYPAWKPEKNNFLDKVHESYKKFNPNAQREAIHAGLECAIFKEKYPDIQIASIGPNIYFPHSNREKCEISSVYNVYKVLEDIIATINKEQNKKA